MFIIFDKDKIKSYLISVSTVTILFMMSFAITNKNDEILKASANITNIENNCLINNINTINGINNEEENNVEIEKSSSSLEDIYD